MSKTETRQVSGVFESEPRGGGYLRDPKKNLLRRQGDPVVPAALSRTAQLQGGETIVATLARKGAARDQRRPVAAELVSIDGFPLADRAEFNKFSELTAIDPAKQVNFEYDGCPTTMRIVDLMTPIGFGQRGLLVASPRTGKTVLLQQMAQSVGRNYPEVELIVLLIDERPEEVTEMRQAVPGLVFASSNDMDTASHVRIARLVIEYARRRVEVGKDVFLLLDSLTRLGRAFNAAIRGGGRIMSGGLDINALNEPKSIFGAARNVEEGGSLTIIASALVDTGSRMDEVIFNEFKGTGNMEIMLSREMANRRLWPAIDLNASGTRKEERLLSPDALETSHRLRRKLHEQGPVRAMESLLAQIEKYPTNEKFIAEFAEASGVRPLGRRRRLLGG